MGQIATMPEAKTFAVINNNFTRYKLPVALGLALAKHESDFNAFAMAKDKRDLARGGSRGMFQVSWKTAQELGFKGSPQDLFDMATCAQLAAQLCADNAKHVKAAIGSDDWVRDVAAWYNGGAPYAHASHDAREYADAVVPLYRAYETELAEEVC